MDEVRLIVCEASARDVGRKIARIPMKAMRELGVSSGDIVEIVGKRSTCAIVWPLSSVEREDLISVDGLLRKSAGVSLNDYVTVRRAAVKEARFIAFSPSGYRLSGLNEDFSLHVKSLLTDKPYIVGDYISIPIFGGNPIYFNVVSTRPQGNSHSFRQHEG